MRRIVGVFTHVDDARNALGRIKKECWDKSEISVLIKQPSREFSYEFAEEFSMERNKEQRRLHWEGLKQETIADIGMVQIGVTNRQNSLDPSEILKNYTNTVPYQLQKNVVGIIEVADELSDKVYTILDSKGADIVVDQRIGE